MKIDRFEDILAWQKSKALSISIYSGFFNSKDFGFKDQICRASVSVMNNIAEGFERKTDNEFKHYLFMAKGSCGEVRSMLLLAKDLNYLGNQEFTSTYNLSIEISKMISGLIKSIK